MRLLHSFLLILMTGLPLAGCAQAPTAINPPPIPTDELPYVPRENFERDGRYGPLGFSRQIRQKKLWAVLYFNKYLELKKAWPEGPKALANARNHRLTGYRYGQIFPFHDGLALVNQKGQHGYIDLRGHQVIKPQFGFGSEDFYRQRAVVTDAAGNQALIDTKGRFVLPFEPGQRLLHPPVMWRDSAEVPLLLRLHHPAPGKPADAATFFTYAGQPAFPNLRLTDALPFVSGLALVRCGAKTGLIDVRGNYVVPCRYDELLLEHIDRNGNTGNGPRPPS